MSVASEIQNKPDNANGILWALLAAALFSIVAAMGKVAVAEFHVLQILFFRQFVIFLSSLPSIRKSFPQSLKTQHLKLHTLRLIGAFIALSCGIWAVAVLPLTTAITLAFAQVFFVAILALFFLKESVGVHRLGAIIFGFAGVITVMRPGIEGIIELKSLIPVVGAAGAAVAITSVRKLTATESTATLMIYQALFVGILAGIPLFWLWVTPEFGWLLYLLAIGVLATIGQWSGMKALRLGEASVVGSMEYTKLIYAAILGLVLFNEVPDIYTTIGAAIIIGSSFYLFRRGKLKKRT